MPKKQWSELTKAEKRVSIAKDVIKQLKAGKIIAKRGTYFFMDDIRVRDEFYTTSVKNPDRDSSEWEIRKNVELQPFLQKAKKCDACALGSMFICEVTERDKFKSKYLCINDKQILKRLDIFSKLQLRLIEAAFERQVIVDVEKKLVIKKGASMNSPDTITTLLAKKAIKFGYKYKSNSKRLIAIMMNLIKNKGQFIP